MCGDVADHEGRDADHDQRHLRGLAQAEGDEQDRQQRDRRDHRDARHQRPERRPHRRQDAQHQARPAAPKGWRCRGRCPAASGWPAYRPRTDIRPTAGPARNTSGAIASTIAPGSGRILSLGLAAWRLAASDEVEQHQQHDRERAQQQAVAAPIRRFTQRIVRPVVAAACRARSRPSQLHRRRPSACSWRRSAA